MHVANYTSSQFGKLLDHYDRREHDGVERSNPNIDAARTALNTVLGGDGRADVRQAVRAAIDSHNSVKRRQGGRSLRSNAAVMSDVVITLPKDCPVEKAPAFFNAVFQWMRERYGDKRVICGFIHYDETTPHMHVPMVPIMPDGTLNRSKVFSRTELQKMHPDLQEYLDNMGGFGHVLLTEEQAVDRALSGVPHDRLDAVRRAFDAKADEIAQDVAQLAAWADRLEEQEAALTRRESAVSAREKAVVQGQHDLEDGWQRLRAACAREQETAGQKQVLIDEIAEWSEGLGGISTRVKTERLQAKIDAAARAADDYVNSVSDALDLQ